MSQPNSHLQAFITDLTAAKSTAIAAAGVLIGTFLPISGGVIKPYELRELVALMNGEDYAPMQAAVPNLNSGAEPIQVAAQSEVPISRLSAEPEPPAAIKPEDPAPIEAAELAPVIEVLQEPIPAGWEDAAAAEDLLAEEVAPADEEFEAGVDTFEG